jgi:photosystem II stability/assembly factor-like uncharacterized protein
VLLSLPLCLAAQWTNIAPNLIKPFQQGYGAIYYADGIIWAGNHELWFSPDTGKTWEMTSYLGRQIRDIYFLDRHNGLIASESGGIHLTRDGGKTWKQILDGEAWEVSFNGSPNIIHALTTAPALFYTSVDGGNTWAYHYLGTYGMSFAIAPSGEIYTFTGERYLVSSRGWVNMSTDYGVTWSNNGGIVDGDSYTLALDSCTPRRLYLVNEDFASSNDGVSQIYLSTNGGLSWEATRSDSGLFFSGSLATTRTTMFVGTVFSGIHRSVDKGNSWQLVGGPQSGYDSRSIFAINDNEVIVLSDKGEVWRTINSGGDSLTTSSVLDTIVSAVTFGETKANLNPLDTVHVGVRVKFAAGSAINTITPYELTYVIQFSTDVVDIRPSDLSKSILPPVGWAYKYGQVVGGRATITLRNVAKKPLEFEQDLGKIIFTALAAPTQQTTIRLEQLTAFTPCNASTAFFGVENGRIRVIAVIDNYVGGTLSEAIPISFFPNPASHTLTLESPLEVGEVVVALFDELGKQVLLQTFTLAAAEPVSLDVRSLASGSYHLRIEASGLKITKRIIINR